MNNRLQRVPFLTQFVDWYHKYCHRHERERALTDILAKHHDHLLEDIGLIRHEVAMFVQPHSYAQSLLASERIQLEITGQIKRPVC